MIFTFKYSNMIEFFWNKSIRLVDDNLAGVTTQIKSRPESNSNQSVTLYSPRHKNWSLNIHCCFRSYSGQTSFSGSGVIALQIFHKGRNSYVVYLDDRSFSRNTLFILVCISATLLFTNRYFFLCVNYHFLRCARRNILNTKTNKNTKKKKKKKKKNLRIIQNFLWHWRESISGIKNNSSTEF